jgi:hypothetical protein
MIYWALVFLIVAIVAGALGLTGVAGMLMVHYGVVQLPHTTTASGDTYGTVAKQDTTETIL